MVAKNGASTPRFAAHQYTEQEPILKDVQTVSTGIPSRVNSPTGRDQGKTGYDVGPLLEDPMLTSGLDDLSL